MKFSIITCTRNSAQWIQESIDSVSTQRDVEVQRVFVDGNSTDGTLEILRQVPGDVTIIENQVDGISRAMNAGAQAATGDVIAHLHSDDFYLEPDVLSRVAAAFAANPDAGWLYGRCKNVIHNKTVDNHFDTTPFSWPALVAGNIIPHPATFIKRDLFDEIGGFSTSLRYTMDYDLWLRLASRNQPIQLSDYLAAFRVHDGSLSNTHIWRCHAECLQVRLRYAPPGAKDQIWHRLKHWRVGLRLIRDLTRRRFGAPL